MAQLAQAVPKKLSTAPKKQIKKDELAASGPKTPEGMFLAIYNKLSGPTREKYKKILTDPAETKKFVKSLNDEVIKQAVEGERFSCYVEDRSESYSIRYVLRGIWGGMRAVRGRSWNGRPCWGIPEVYSHGEPQVCTVDEYKSQIEQLYKDAGITSRLYLDILAAQADADIQSGEVKTVLVSQRKGLLLHEAAIQPKILLKNCVRRSCWMPGVPQYDKGDGKESDAVRWCVASNRMLVGMFCGTQPHAEKQMLKSELFIGHEALDHGQFLRRVKYGDGKLRWLVRVDEFCTDNEYRKQSMALYHDVGISGDDLVVMEQYTEFVVDIGMLPAYAKRRKEEKSVALASETKRRDLDLEFTGIKRVLDDDELGGTGRMSAEKEKLLEELLAEKAKQRKKKKESEGATKGLKDVGEQNLGIKTTGWETRLEGRTVIK